MTKKISLAAARIKRGLQSELTLGNLDARRDWGYAPEYVEAMWRMLQQEKPDDFVLATGETHSVEDFLNAAFASLDLDGRDYVKFEPRFVRPAEVGELVGNSAKAKAVLGWKPNTHLGRLTELMVQADLAECSG